MDNSNSAPGFARNPGHSITVEPFPGTVTVKLGDTILASSKNAMLLKEGSYPAVHYIPFDDIYFEHLHKTETSTHCPYKGDANYWRASAGGQAAKDAMWAYETPYDEMAQIASHGAFYADRVNIDAAAD